MSKPRLAVPARWVLAAVLGGGSPVRVGAEATPPPVPVTVPLPEAGYPTPNPPTESRPSEAPTGRASEPGLAGANVYSIGEPTDEEQLYVEFINRSRADPRGEAQRMVATTDPDILSAYRFFGVDLAGVTRDYDAIAVVPPVSINGALTDAARVHAQDLFQNEFQGHDGTDGSNPGTRITRAGYNWQTYGENVYSYARSVWHGHVGFEVDWGPGPGGVQSPPGHRNTLHNAAFREVGVGVVLGTKGRVGPQLVAQDFASPQGAKPFVTGVVYYDLNGNQFYDLGEGLGGVTVRVSGTAVRAVTARSGGYSVPVAGNGTYAVTFEVPGLAAVEKSAVVAGNANVKVDHVPSYSPPTLGGSSVANVGQPNPYVFSPVGGATRYQWRSLKRQPWTTPEGAESGFGRLTPTISSGYNAITAGARQVGNWSFHLAMPRAESQYLGTVQPLLLGAASEVRFGSRLGLASSAQVARVQVSTDEGTSWTDLWTQAGTGSTGELTFTTRSVSLAAYAGRTVRIRFAYTFSSGSYFPQIAATAGWCLDEIVVTDSEELGAERISDVASGTAFSFVPDAEGLFLLQVRAGIGDRALPWGPALAGTARVGPSTPPVVRVQTLTPVAGGAGTWLLGFRVEQGSPAVLEIQSAPAATGPWAAVNGARVDSLGAGNYQASLTAPAAPAQQFYRVAAR